MPSLVSYINTLLPFATPGTPLIQDLLHLAVVCTVLYFAPQAQEWLQKRTQANEQAGALDAEPFAAHPTGNVIDDDEAAAEDAEEPLDTDQDVVGEQLDPRDNDDRPDNEAFQDFADQRENDDGAAGPANAAANPPPNPRNVGAKKAKSLAKRDQRRAYHEFQRAQGEAQRARDAEGAGEREAAHQAERERRKAAEAKLEAKKAEERRKKREQERREREDEIARREVAITTVRRELDERRMSNLIDVARQVGGDVDDVWVEKMLNASGVLGRDAEGTVTMVTSTGWVVRVRREDMLRLYEKAANDGLGNENGKIAYEELGGLLETILKSKA